MPFGSWWQSGCLVYVLDTKAHQNSGCLSVERWSARIQGSGRKWALSAPGLPGIEAVVAS